MTRTFHPSHPSQPTRHYLTGTTASAASSCGTGHSGVWTYAGKFGIRFFSLWIVRLKRGKIVKLIADAKCAVKCAAALSPIVRFWSTQFSKEEKCPTPEKLNMALTFSLSIQSFYIHGGPIISSDALKTAPATISSWQGGDVDPALL